MLAKRRLESPREAELEDGAREKRSSSRDYDLNAKGAGKNPIPICSLLLTFLATAVATVIVLEVLGLPRRPEVPASLPAAQVEGARTAARPVMAFATTLTKVDGAAFLDAVEVLGLSIDQVCATSAYECAKVAILHDGAGAAAAVALHDLGWRVLVRPVPIDVAAIENEFYREALPKSGCCGETELLKLHAYTLTEYARVLHVDADVLLLKGFDDLFALNASLVYTNDPSMGNAGNEGAPPVQGGFLLIRPDLAVYEELRQIVLKGDWRPGTGWGGTNIGWCWGGPTIQGLLPYYYTIVRPDLPSIALDNCLYNHMFDSATCRSQPTHALDQMYSVHFTACQKPWYCHRDFADPVCGAATHKWHDLWRQLAAQHTNASPAAQQQQLGQFEQLKAGQEEPCDRANKYVPLPRAEGLLLPAQA